MPRTPAARTTAPSATPDQPSLDQPTTDQPITSQPSTDQPTTDQPITDRSTTDRPSAGQPSAGQPPAAPAVAAGPTATSPAERTAATARARDDRAAATAQARAELQTASPRARLPIALAPADASLPPRPASRLRAHGTLVYTSTEALQRGVAGFERGAYPEWYSAADLKVDGVTVRVDLEVDLEVDCVGFGASFRDLARHAAGGHVDVAWERGLTPARYEAGSATASVVVPPVPPGARARHGQLARTLQSPLVTDRQGHLASAQPEGVVIAHEDGSIATIIAAAVSRLVWLDADRVIAQGLLVSTTDSERHGLVLLDRATGAITRSLDVSHEATVSAASPDGFFVVHRDNGAQLFDATAQVIATTRLARDTHIQGTAVSPRGALVALADPDGLSLWTPAAPKAPLKRIAGHFRAATFLADGTVVALGTTDPTVKNPWTWLTRFDATGAVLGATRAGKELDQVQPAGDGVVGSYSYNGTLAHFGPDLKKRWALELPRDLTPSWPVVSRDGTTLLGASAHDGLLGFDLATGERTTDHALAITAVAASSTLLATLDEGGDLIVRDQATGTAYLRQALTLKAEKNAHLAFSPDGRTLAVADSDRLIMIELETRSVRELPRDRLTAVAFARDGTRVTGHADGVIRRSRPDHTDEQSAGGDVRRVATAASSTRVAVALRDGTVKVLIDDREPRTFRTSKDLLGTLALSPDGAHVVLARSRKERGSTVSQLVLASVDDGSETVLLERVRPACCAFSPDGRRLVVNDRHRLTLLALPEGRVTGRLSGHTLPVRALAFSPDGTLFSSSEDATTLAWDLTALDALGGGHPDEDTSSD